MDEALYLIIRRNMNERDLYESMQKLNPSVDRLGRERDFKENIMQCIKYLDDEIKEIKRRLNETTK